MRICSLLPGITDTLVALGVADQVVAVTHECDVPTGHAVAVTASRIPSGASSAEIDRRVSETGQGLYELDETRLRELQPDLILTQMLCDVCAVNENLVRQVAGRLPGRVPVESFQPTTVAEVFEMFARIGERTGRQREAAELTEQFQQQIERVRRRVEGQPRPRVLCLEWVDPPFTSGHWTPELVDLAGGRECLGRAGKPSQRTTWSAIREAQPEVIVIAPCGYTIEQTLREWHLLEHNADWPALPAVKTGRVYVADGHHYFNRPGPHLLETLLILAACIHPEVWPEPALPEGVVCMGAQGVWPHSPVTQRSPGLPPQR